MTIPACSLGELVRALPGVKPRLARRVAEQRLRAAGMLNPDATWKYPAAVERCGSYDLYIVVHPAGARFLLDVYRRGELPMQPKVKPLEPPEWLARIAGMSDEDIAAHEAEQPLSAEHLEDAYWRWMNQACPYPRYSAEARSWRKAVLFEYRGVQYTRDRYIMRSNSGKSVVGGTTTFYGADGSVFSCEGPAPNRRNDPDRNWGLGPE